MFDYKIEFTIFSIHQQRIMWRQRYQCEYGCKCSNVLPYTIPMTTWCKNVKYLESVDIYLCFEHIDVFNTMYSDLLIEGDSIYDANDRLPDEHEIKMITNIFHARKTLLSLQFDNQSYFHMLPPEIICIINNNLDVQDQFH